MIQRTRKKAIIAVMKSAKAIFQAPPWCASSWLVAFDDDDLRVMVGHGSILVYEKSDRSGRIRASEIVKVGRALEFARRASRRSSRLPAKANACRRTFGEKACVGVDALGEPRLTTIPAPPHSWPRLRRKRC